MTTERAAQIDSATLLLQNLVGKTVQAYTEGDVDPSSQAFVEDALIYRPDRDCYLVVIHHPYQKRRPIAQIMFQASDVKRIDGSQIFLR